MHSKLLVKEWLKVLDLGMTVEVWGCVFPCSAPKVKIFWWAWVNIYVQEKEQPIQGLEFTNKEVESMKENLSDKADSARVAA